jgi:hypothetical protein
MTWQEIREAFPNRWLVLETLEAHEEGNQRIITSAAVLAQFGDNGNAAWDEYVRLHRLDRTRDYFPFHTANEALTLIVKKSIRRMLS